MTLKEARQECRKLAIEHNSYWWSLCWHKRFGYYPSSEQRDTNHICYVHKNGTYMYASKENEKKHNLKGNICK